jgi:thymidine kinase
MKADHTIDDLNLVTVQSSVLYAIDEIQFYNDSILGFVERVLLQPTAAIIMSGLDLDYRRKEFGFGLKMARRVLESHESCSVHRLAAKCACPVGVAHTSNRSDNLHHRAVCSNPAPYTQRLLATETQGPSIANNVQSQVLIGDAWYQPACSLHHQIEVVPLSEWRASASERITVARDLTR